MNRLPRAWRKHLVIPLPSLRELAHRSSAVAQAAYVRGNAAGVHGGRRPKYGKRERQRCRRDERSL